MSRYRRLYLLSESSLSYVYAVGKQPDSNVWCKMEVRGGAYCEIVGIQAATRFVL